MNYHVTEILTAEPQLVHIQNEGQTITSTNWWSLPVGEHLCFASIHAGCIRLLLPPAAITSLSDMKAGVDQIVFSICTRPSSNEFAAELIFDDGSDAPFVIHLYENQLDRVPESNSAPGRFRFDVYVDHNGPMRVLSSEATVRFVPRLPWMKPIKRAHRKTSHFN